MSGPLAGVRVLDLSRLLPGAYCTLMLADLGADVIKIEEPGRGDPMRLMPPMVNGGSALHRALDRGKRSVAVDLRRPEGVEVLRRLVREAGVLVESFRPGVLDRAGAGYEALSAENPALVFASLSGYGQDGPYRDRAGHDINYLSYAGILDTTGAPDGPPVPPSVQVADLAGAMAAAVGIASCLLEASRTGRGRHVDAALMDAAVSWLAVLAPMGQATGEVPRRGRTPLTGAWACYRVYATGDGRFLSVGAIEPRFWETLCRALGVPELAAEQYAPGERQQEIAARLAEIFASRPRDAWMAALEGLDACVAPVNDLAEALADPQVRHRRMLAEVDGEVVGLGPPVRVSGGEPALRPAPALGQHTAEVLTQAGLGAQEISSLRDAGVV